MTATHLLPDGITLQFDDVPLVEANNGFSGMLIACEAEIAYRTASDWSVSSIRAQDGTGLRSVDLFAENPTLYAIVANAIERTQGEYISREIAAFELEAA